MTISILLQEPQAPNAVALGRLVLDISAPWQDFCPFSLELSPEVDVMVTRFLPVDEVFERTANTKFHRNIINSLVGRRERLSGSVHSPQGSRFCLINSGHHFEKMCRDMNVRRWFEDVITRGFDVYMVVGMITLRDATITHTIETRSVVRGIAQAPVTEISSPGLTGLRAVAVGTLLDSGMGIGHAAKRTIGARYFAPGERVMAVQYRKTRFSWFSRRSLDKAYLEKGNRWIIDSSIARSEEDEDIEDVITAEVEDLSKEDLKGLRKRVYEIGANSETFVLLE